MIHFEAFKKKLIRHVILISILFLLPFSLIGHLFGQVASQSGYNLIGIIRSGNFSGAVINVAKGEQSFFRLFEKLPDGSQIVQVRDDSISIKGTDGTLYDMFISHEKTPESVTPLPSNNNSSGVAPPPPASTPNNAGSGPPVARTRYRGHTPSD